MNPVSARLLNQQLICPKFTAPREVVEWMGAMQAQDYKMMRWAVGMRTKKPSAKAFEDDYNSGRIVRAHLFRTTWQLVTGEDWRWMLELCRVNALRGMAGWMHSNGVSIPGSEQEAIQAIFADYLSSRRTALKADLGAALLERGITMEDHRLSYHIRLAEYGGLLCSGDLHPQKPTYALADKKIPRAGSFSKEESLARLARTYFQSHGPATLEDFVWWSGLNISDCRKGMDSVRAELVSIHWKGLAFFIHEDSRTRGFRSGTVTLLPPYDEYLIGYKSRHLSVHQDHMHRVHSGNGIFWPVILLDGQVVGNWNAAGGKLDYSTFNPDIIPCQDALQEQISRYAQFLGR